MQFFSHPTVLNGPSTTLGLNTYNGRRTLLGSIHEKKRVLLGHVLLDTIHYLQVSPLAVSMN